MYRIAISCARSAFSSQKTQPDAMVGGGYLPAARADAVEAEFALRAACRQLDKAASKGVIHKNQAANRKSAIARRFAEIQA